MVVDLLAPTPWSLRCPAVFDFEVSTVLALVFGELVNNHSGDSHQGNSWYISPASKAET